MHGMDWREDTHTELRRVEFIHFLFYIYVYTYSSMLSTFVLRAWVVPIRSLSDTLHFIPQNSLLQFQWVSDQLFFGWHTPTESFTALQKSLLHSTLRGQKIPISLCVILHARVSSLHSLSTLLHYGLRKKVRSATFLTLLCCTRIYKVHTYVRTCTDFSPSHSILTILLVSVFVLWFAYKGVSSERACSWCDVMWSYLSHLWRSAFLHLSRAQWYCGHFVLFSCLPARKSEVKRNHCRWWQLWSSSCQKSF